MKNLMLVTIFIGLSVNCAEQFQVNPPGGLVVDNIQQDANIQPIIVIQPAPVNIQPVNNINRDISHYSYLESRHNNMIAKVKDDFIQKIKSLNLQEKKAIERYIRAYISSLDEVFILQKSTELDYEFVKLNFNQVFEDKQKELVNILNNNPSLYPIVKKLSLETKNIVESIPKKIASIFSGQIKDNTQLPFDYLKKLYVSIHIDLLGSITCDLINLDNPELFVQFLKWYKECDFYYLKNDKVFMKILEVLQLQKARYAKALESNKIQAQAHHSLKLEGLLSKDFSQKIVSTLQSKVDLITADSYTSAFSLFRASQEDKLKAKIIVWEAKLKFYEDCEKLLRSIINSHNIQAKL